MNITLKEVARLAGVSPSTVSRTCTNHPSISEQTKEKVRKAMLELGYEPNTPISSPNTKTIGIVLPASEKDTYENSFFLETMRGISQFCNQKQYFTTFITGASSKEILQYICQMSKEDRLDGVILLYSSRQDPIVDYLYTEGLQFVIIGKADKYIQDTIYIDNDNIQAARDAASYLISLGHTRIAYLGCDSARIFSADRKAGYLLALTEQNIPFRPEYYIEMPFIPYDESEELKKLLSMKERPTAFIVNDDIHALMLTHTAFCMDLKIPEELSIVSFNNSIAARLASPPLTSIDINSRQLGIEAASQIINHIENPSLLPTTIIVPIYLKNRKRCAAPPD